MTDTQDPRPATDPGLPGGRWPSVPSHRARAGRRRPMRPAVPRTCRGPVRARRSTARSARSRTTCCGWAAWWRTRSRCAIQALEQHDADLALAVITGDGRLNEAQRLISALVARTIATQQPVARDLRFLLALDHVAYDLERMGDHASSVAKQARKLAPVAHGEANGRLAEMGRLTSTLTREVLRALVDQDEALAREVAARDDEVDDLYHATFADMLDLMRADPANVDRGTRVLFAAHYLERIGDRVTNVAEDVVFLATGETEDLNP